MTYTRLVLFDIDGTLLWPDGIGRASMKTALEQVYGTSGPIDGYQFIGQTDLDTVSVLMGRAGLAPALIAERFPQLEAAMETALAGLVESRQHNIRPCTGGPELVTALASRPDTLLGLITGNVRPTAEIKLRAVGYDTSVFRVGAFGSHSPLRADLPPVAVAEARQLIGITFSGKQITIIGDTPADITCGRGVGARSIAVATGWIGADVLRQHQPDFLFDDLTDTQAVLGAILAPA
jgi:phosphoglycolate phosphatase-like HAD superfamily hydrolase